MRRRMEKEEVGGRRTIQVVQIALYIITTNFQRCKAAPESFTVSWDTATTTRHPAIRHEPQFAG